VRRPEPRCRLLGEGEFAGLEQRKAVEQVLGGRCIPSM
jgi:hypothetical protein